MVTSLSAAPMTTPLASAKAFLAGHVLTAFVGFAFAWSWTVAWIQTLVPGGAGPLFQFGPPLAAMAVSGILDPRPCQASRLGRVVLFGLVAGVAFVTWVGFFTLVVVEEHSLAFLANGMLVAALAGLVISAPLAGREGVRSLLRPLYQWRVGGRWYAVALLLMPATFLAGIALAHSLGDALPPLPYGSPSAAWMLALIWIVPFGGGMEEAGWRGFALPRLQVRHSPLVASLLLSCVWAAWHTPEYLNGFYPDAAAGSVIGAIVVRLLLFTPPLAILMTRAFNGARGSLLVVVLMHATYNAASTLLPLSSNAYALSFVVQWIVAIAVVGGARMWRPLSGSPAVPTADRRSAHRPSRRSLRRGIKGEGQS
jgi:membrane protease YdiL (CAAX protease family)